ncbi:MAG: DUF6883 domain-containing protein [Gemmatimonadales bacterium]
MRLPAAERAFIDPTKIRDYLLSAEHPIGRFKAAVFRAAGYSRDDWKQLQKDLLVLAQAGEVSRGGTTRFGSKYLVRGRLGGAADRSVRVISVWIVRTAEDFPRFVTAYPEEGP